MTGADMHSWLERMGWSDMRAAKELGISRNSLVKYKQVGAPTTIGLACAALAAGLGVWGQGQ